MVVHAHEIVSFLADRVIAVAGDNAVTAVGPAALDPGAPGRLSFASRMDEATSSALARTASSVVLVRPDHLNLAPQSAFRIAVSEPRLEFARLCQQFFAPVHPEGIHPSAVVHETAVIGRGARIAAGVVVGADVVTGDRVTLAANCVIGDGCRLGDDVIIGPGSVIGHTGFGYSREEDGTPVIVPHFGSVRIGDRVEIGANAAVDRGTLDDTVIGNDAKIDNLVHIAHNSQIGRGAFVIASAVICGGVQLGDRAWVAPNAVVKEQIVVGKDALLGLSSTVLRDVPDGATVIGSPARQLPLR